MRKSESLLEWVRKNRKNDFKIRKDANIQKKQEKDLRRPIYYH